MIQAYIDAAMRLARYELNRSITSCTVSSATRPNCCGCSSAPTCRSTTTAARPTCGTWSRNARSAPGPAASEVGRQCRDTFASLKKTCRKQGVSFWEYLKDRVFDSPARHALKSTAPAVNEHLWIFYNLNRTAIARLFDNLS